MGMAIACLLAVNLLAPDRRQVRRDLDGRHPHLALAEANRYLQSFPGDPRGFFLRARIREILGDTPGALRDLRRAQTLTGRPSPSVLFERLAIQGRSGQFRSALATVGQLIRLEPDAPRGYLLRSELWAKLGRPRRALADLGKVSSLARPGSFVETAAAAERRRLLECHPSRSPFGGACP